MSNVSKRFAATCSEISIRFLREMIELSCRHILLKLLIPSVFITLTNECDQLSEFLRRKLIDRSFDLSQAHISI